MKIPRPRFTLRHMMVFVTGVCMGLGVFLMWLSQIKLVWHEEQLAIAKIHDAGCLVVNVRVTGPDWLRYFVEDKYRNRVTSVELWDITDEPLPARREIEYLLAFSELENLTLQGSSFNDDHMSVVSRISTLKLLICFDTDISKSGIETIASMNHLEHLSLDNLKDFDNSSLEPLAGIKNLLVLSITSFNLQPDAELIFLKMRPDVKIFCGGMSLNNCLPRASGRRWPPGFGPIASAIRINSVPSNNSVSDDGLGGEKENRDKAEE